MQDALGWLVEFLDTWLERSEYRIGGGTVLASRWQHRHSTDLDLFSEEKVYREVLEPLGWQEITALLNQFQEEGSITKLTFGPNTLSFQYSGVPMSFNSMPRITEGAISSDQEESTGIFAESNTEILFKKLRGRMVNSSTYVARDLYDLVVCYGLERQSFNDAFSSLIQRERDSLRYDVEIGDARVDDLIRVIEPRYPELVSSLDRFNQIAGEVLSQNVSPSTKELLERIGIL